MPVKSNERLEALFNKYLNGVCTNIEREELLSFINEAQYDQQLKKLMDRAWAKVSSTYEVSDEQSERILSGILTPFGQEANIIRNRKRRLILRWSAVAAVFAAVIAIGGLWFKNQSLVKQSSVRIAANKNDNNDMAPGGNRAVLTLANGNKIILDSMKKGVLQSLNSGKIVKVSNGLIAFNQTLRIHEPSLSTEYNTLTTPPGGQYKVILPDGSRVWLNAASSLRFPVVFTGKERNVDLIGEAYFEIAPNKDVPFNVRTNGVQVKVLGTHFDIMSYADEPTTKTTLLEGSVMVSKGKDKVVLKPGQQASVTPDHDNIKINKANINEATAWKNGLFFFHNTDIQSALRQIARWYNIKVVYNGDVAANLNGMISRNTDLSQVLHMLEVTSNIHFKIEGREVIVLSKDRG